MGFKGVLIHLALCVLVVYAAWSFANANHWLEPEPPQIVPTDNTTIDAYAQQGYAIHFVDRDKNPMAMRWVGDVEQNNELLREMMGDEEKALFVSFIIDSDGYLGREYSIVTRAGDSFRVLISLYPRGERYGSGKLFFYLNPELTTPREIVYEKSTRGGWMMIGMMSSVGCFFIYMLGLTFRIWKEQRAVR
jgi:hypothetical protein